MSSIRQWINICEGRQNVSTSSPAKMFIDAAKADPRTSFCTFDANSDTSVILTWLEGNGGLVPFLTQLADKFGVTLELMVEVYDTSDGGKLVPYYAKNGFVAVDSDFPANFDFLNMPKSRGNLSDLAGTVAMERKPR